jgi:predicted nucleic acid-binding protein
VAEPKELVVDASVVVKWFTSEIERDIALELRQAHISKRVRLVAPDLMMYEVSNALRYNTGFNLHDKTQAIEVLFRMYVRTMPPSAETLTQATQLSEKFDISIYDAIYLSMAEAEGFGFVTADKRLYAEMKENRRALLLSSNQVRELCLGVGSDQSKDNF